MSDNKTTPSAKLASESYDEKFDRMRQHKAETTWPKGALEDDDIKMDTEPKKTNIEQGIGDARLAAAFVAVIVVPFSICAIAVAIGYVVWRIFS